MDSIKQNLRLFLKLLISCRYICKYHLKVPVKTDKRQRDVFYLLYESFVQRLGQQAKEAISARRSRGDAGL